LVGQQTHRSHSRPSPYSLTVSRRSNSLNSSALFFSILHLRLSASVPLRVLSQCSREFIPRFWSAAALLPLFQPLNRPPRTSVPSAPLRYYSFVFCLLSFPFSVFLSSSRHYSFLFFIFRFPFLSPCRPIPPRRTMIRAIPFPRSLHM